MQQDRYADHGTGSGGEGYMRLCLEIIAGVTGTGLMGVVDSSESGWPRLGWWS